jgi:hypothetical protein|nr:MAG TPA: Protein of unknown function (DUF2634) [Caudoviricetes sp.]
MIPAVTGFLKEDFEIEEQPDKTYKMQETILRGKIEGKEAVRQAVYKILNTERYQYPVYSWDYGIELVDLYGEPFSYVCPELERRITEALTWDTRIQSADNFTFEQKAGGRILVTFTVHTVYGDIDTEQEVDVSV